MVASIGVPYVWFTNFTAYRLAILSHAFLMWLFVPIMMVATKKAWESYFGHKNLNRYFVNLTTMVIALTGSVALMLITINQIMTMSFDRLVVPPLFTALMPVYTCYALIETYTAWKGEKDRILKLELEKSRAAWSAPSVQIKPHFLFNSLNMLEHLVESSPDIAQVCIRRFADLYRGILESSNKLTVTLADEIELVRNYLYIQKLRIGDRLEITIDVPESLLGVALPPNVILNCVENSVKHGFEKSLAKGRLRVNVSEENGKVKIEISNESANAVDTELATSATSSGFGQDYIRNRLRLLYGGAASFEFVPSATSGRATIRIPKSIAEVAAKMEGQRSSRKMNLQKCLV